MNNNPITIEAIVQAPLSIVWEAWTKPEHITQWAFASDDWEAPAATNDLRVGGTFSTTMSAKDKSAGFDLTGVYSVVEEHARIEYDLPDGRHVTTLFEETPEGVKVTETFDPEQENSEERQRGGWQAILNNFKKHAEHLALISAQ